MAQKTNTRTYIRKRINNEEVPPEVIEALKKAEAEIERGEGIPLEVALKEMKEKYKI